MILSEIANVRTAPVFRDKAPQASAQGNVRALTIGQLVRGSSISWSALEKVKVDERFLDHCLRPGELVIASRGDHYPVWLFEGVPEPVCPVGQFHIITPTGAVEPMYLSWYLNRPATQMAIRLQTTGTSIRALKKAELLTLEIPTPSMRVQQRIADLYATTQEAVAVRQCLNDLDTLEASQLSEQWLQDEVSHG